MGNPHYNTWGGKNNSWGNKNKKDKNNNGPQYSGDFNPLGKAIIGGVFLLAISYTGLSTAADFVLDVKGKIEDAQEIKETAKKLVNKSGDEVYENGKFEIDWASKFELGAEDVRDILQFAIDKCPQTEQENVIIIDYKALEKEGKFEKKVLKTARKHKKEDSIAMLFVNTEKMTDSEMNKESDRAMRFVETNNDFSIAGFDALNIYVRKNSPENGNITVLVKYSQR